MSRERLIVVATEDACGFDGKVSAQLGRSPFFLMAEADGRMATVSKVVPNPCSGAHRPGAVPRFVRDLGADVIIAGGMEPGAIEIFERSGIEVATGVNGTVATVLGAYLSGEHGGWCPAPMTTRIAVVKTAGKAKEIAMNKVAISIVQSGDGLDNRMDDRFGRAQAFLVVDRSTGEVVETIDNASVAASHGAGSGAANLLKSAGVRAVISGRFGPKASDALAALGMESWLAPPGITAGEAVRLLRDGALEQT